MKYHIDDSYMDDTPSAVLYRRTMDHYPKSTIGCFIISDDWSEQELLDLKKKSKAWFLVGLQTDNMDFERLDIIEGVIRCQPNEINDVIKLLDVNSASTIIGIDVIDIKSLFERGYSFQFIQVSATNESESDVVKAATKRLVSQLAKAHHIKGLLVTVKSVESPSPATIAHISESVENSLSIDYEFIYYSASMNDERNSLHLKAIYALA